MNFSCVFFLFKAIKIESSSENQNSVLASVTSTKTGDMKIIETMNAFKSKRLEALGEERVASPRRGNLRVSCFISLIIFQSYKTVELTRMQNPLC